MTGTDSYSTTPATNATADGGAINWAEGQAPSTVNNTARQWMADQRASFNDLAWFQYGTGDQGAGNLAVPAVYASGTSFTIAGANVTAVYHVGRRVRAVGSGTGTIYGSITITSYAPTTTTVTVQWDSGSLTNETLVISISQVPLTGAPVAGPIRFPSAQVSSSNVNTLDDYEEGTFTITLVPGTSGTITLNGSFNTGYYTKIGRNVTVYGLASVSSVSSPVGTLSILTLPFAVQTAAPFGMPFTILLNAVTGACQPGGVALSTGTSIEVNDYITGTAANIANLVQASTVVYFSGTYPAAT